MSGDQRQPQPLDMRSPKADRPAGTQQVRHCAREGVSRNTRPLKIPAKARVIRHMIMCPSSLE